jgi:hypothetical protein
VPTTTSALVTAAAELDGPDLAPGRPPGVRYIGAGRSVRMPCFARPVHFGVRRASVCPSQRPPALRRGRPRMRPWRLEHRGHRQARARGAQRATLSSVARTSDSYGRGAALKAARPACPRLGTRAGDDGSAMTGRCWRPLAVATRTQGEWSTILPISQTVTGRHGQQHSDQQILTLMDEWSTEWSTPPTYERSTWSTGWSTAGWQRVRTHASQVGGNR